MSQTDLIEALLLTGYLAEDGDDFCRRSINHLLGRLNARSMLAGTVEKDGRFHVQGSFGFTTTRPGRLSLKNWQNTEIETAIKTESPTQVSDSKVGSRSFLESELNLAPRHERCIVFPFSKFKLTIGATLISFDLDAAEEALKSPELNAAIWSSELYCSTRVESPKSANRLFGQDLSQRQLEINRLCLEGKTNLQIARELHLSESSVKQELTRIFRKLGISSRTELEQFSV